MVVSEYSNGFSISFGVPVKINENVPRKLSKRGAVTRFSSKSCSRLRNLLLKLHRPAGSYTLAITLTIPGKASPEDWRKMLERFRYYLARLKIGMIWRVELQRRGVPHLHCVAVCDKIESSWGIWNAWVRTCDGVYEGLLPSEQGYICLPWSAHRGFIVYGFSCRVVQSAGWFGYVAAHTAKNKQVQSGWLGRQWGIFNEKALTFEESVSATVDDRFMVFLCRCIRRRWRCRVNCNSRGSRQFFCSPQFMESAKRFYYRDMPF